MNKTLRNIVIPVLMISALALQHHNTAAQDLNFTQYYLNLPATNPAFTGIEPYLDMKAAFRQRWTGFDDKNNSIYLSGYTSLGRTSPTVFKNNSLRISNPSAYDNVANSTSIRRIHGVGGMVTSQTVGPYKAIGLNFNYAYHLPLTKQLSMSMGAKVNYTNHRITFADYVVRNPDEDQFYQDLINASEGSEQLFTGDLGVTLYSSKFYVGISSGNLISQPIGGDELLKIVGDKYFDLISGIQIEMTPLITLYPALRLSHSEIYNTTWEANVRARYKESIYFGVAYENDVKGALLFGLTLDQKFNINYSYDYYFNDLKPFNTGNHEFTIGMAIFNKYSTPARLW